MPRARLWSAPLRQEAGLTATEVRRRAAAAAARERREQLAAKPKRRRLRSAIKVLAAVALLAADSLRGLVRKLARSGSSAPTEAGRTALYRGLPYELPFGVKLYEERYSSPLQTASLPPRRRTAVTGHSLRSRSDATALLEEIEKTEGIP